MFEQERPGFDAMVGNPPFWRATQSGSCWNHRSWAHLHSISKPVSPEAREIPTWWRLLLSARIRSVRSRWQLRTVCDQYNSPKVTPAHGALDMDRGHGGRDLSAAQRRIQVAWCLRLVIVCVVHVFRRIPGRRCRVRRTADRVDAITASCCRQAAAQRFRRKLATVLRAPGSSLLREGFHLGRQAGASLATR